MPKRAKKKAEPAVAGETPAPRHEPGEAELKAATEAGLDRQAEAQVDGPSAAEPNEAEAELIAEAADTFEQAFEERLPPDRRVPVPVEAGPSAPVRAGEEAAEPAADTEEEAAELPAAERPPARLDRLQKILSQAGIASRRHAEEMITEGRVQVNGKVVTELGSKADPDHDHIRVDGKLLHGAERLRYFVLNKPKGFVTTVSDPEGRPTVMQFFKKMNERLYPVGRLDYQSEGLLLVTNDGDLANKLTKASTGVEKTYLVKVSGQPAAEEMARLRAGIEIDRGGPGEGRVRTAPATIREVRQGDNPWFEVVLTEGRNRELRKMFEEIGHHMEKIRRVGYGPLVLDLEPGKFRELDPQELTRLRLAADGKWRKPKAKEREPRREFGRRAEGEQRRGPAPRTGQRGPARGQEWKPEKRGEWRGRAATPASRESRPSSAAPFRPGPGSPKRGTDRGFETGANRQRPPREDWREGAAGGRQRPAGQRPAGQRPAGRQGFETGRGAARGFQGGRNRPQPTVPATEARRPNRGFETGANRERPARKEWRREDGAAGRQGRSGRPGFESPRVDARGSERGSARFSGPRKASGAQQGRSTPPAGRGQPAQRGGKRPAGPRGSTRRPPSKPRGRPGDRH
jgi:23S rRNA pseudouridine2605 synthase